MASLKEYGIRFISHGCWSDPEIEWEKSDHQKLLFNYWDVAECTDYEELCESTEDSDLQELVAQLWELTPSEYARPRIDYEWEVSNYRYYGIYDDADYFKEYKLSTKEDFILHNASQALRQALDYLNDWNCNYADIQIFRNSALGRELVANYSFQGSTLKDVTCYKK